MDKEELHAALDEIYVSTNAIKMLVHALIDLDAVTEISCQWDTCTYSSRSFHGSGKGCPTVLSIDHRLPKHEGGGDRFYNLRIVHRGCNNSWKKGRTHSDEWKANIARAHQAKAKITMICPECGQKCKGSQGLDSHRRRKHGSSGAHAEASD